MTNPLLRRSRCVLASLGVATAQLLAQSGWVQLSPGTNPPARGFHNLCYDVTRGVTVMFGGWDNTPLGDTWEWNGTDWTQRQTANAPSARCCHAMAYDMARGVVVLFGGTDGSSIDWNDTWEYDGIDWTLRTPQNSPSPRREPRFAYDLTHGYVLLFGGGNGSNGVPVYSDTWTWDGSDWTQRNPATTPPARWSDGIAHDLANGGVLMYGGAAGSVTALGDTWHWDGTDWSQLQATTSPPALTRTAMAFDLGAGVAVLLGGLPTAMGTWLWDGRDWMLDSRPSPGARQTFGIAYDLRRGRTVLFGGMTGNYLGDTWEYDASGRAAWVPYGTGCAGSSGIPVLSARLNARPLLGGPFVLELTNVPGSGPAAISIGFSDQLWNGLPLPWSMTPLGMPGCQLLASPDVMLLVPVAAGRATLSWPLPNDLRLVGTRFFDQAFVVDPTANPLGATVSNGGAGILGVF